MTRNHPRNHPPGSNGNHPPEPPPETRTDKGRNHPRNHPEPPPPGPSTTWSPLEGDQWYAPTSAGRDSVHKLTCDQFEERHRRAKVSAILVTLITEGRSAEEVARWHADRWVRVADRVGCRPPSVLTLLDVIEQLERREARIGRRVA